MKRDSLGLHGLDGSNPLAFLAALGTLRALNRAWSDRAVAMSWIVHDGRYVPKLHARDVVTESSVIDALVRVLGADASAHPLAFLKASGTGDSTNPQSIRETFKSCADKAQRNNREPLDWLSALSSDLAPNATSQLQTVRRDYFWGNLESIMQLTSPDHLRRTLFSIWDYSDPLENRSLHIEPSEDRRHAYQWSQPSGDPERKRRGGMLGANRLAIEAFPLFQSVALNSDKLSTRGFSGNRVDDTRWTWPIWECDTGLGVDVVASLLALSELQREVPDPRKLSAYGIRAAMRSRRILVDKTPNISPSIAV
jgi:CRISPR-associated endonuclease/helicase Cas3